MSARTHPSQPLPEGEITFSKPVTQVALIFRIIGYVLLILGSATLFGLTGEVLSGTAAELKVIAMGYLFSAAMIFFGYKLVSAIPGWKVIVHPEGEAKASEHFMQSEQYVKLREERGGLPEEERKLIEAQSRGAGRHRIVSFIIPGIFFILLLLGGFSQDKATVVISIDDYQEVYFYEDFFSDSYALNSVSGAANLEILKGDETAFSHSIKSTEIGVPEIELKITHAGELTTMTFTETLDSGDTYSYDWIIEAGQDRFDRMLVGKTVLQPTKESFEAAQEVQEAYTVLEMANVFGTQPSEVELTNRESPLPSLIGSFIDRGNDDFDLKITISYSGNTSWELEAPASAFPQLRN